jgi:hypothetical protein
MVYVEAGVVSAECPCFGFHVAAFGLASTHSALSSSALEGP